MPKLTSEQKVEKIINQIAEQENLDGATAKTQLHKFVCQGKCHWYQSRKPPRKRDRPERFDRLDLTEQQQENIWNIVSQVMKGTTKGEARKEIHRVIC
jgi:DNA-binding MarR family transcriptional regulator